MYTWVSLEVNNQSLRLTKLNHEQLNVKSKNGYSYIKQQIGIQKY